jgi:hypothetical protein
MAIETLTQTADEESTYVITAVPKDESGSAVTPTTFHWQLTDGLGNVVNSRTDVTPSPSTSIDIVLTGDDLAIGSNGSLTRVVTMWGNYNSSKGTGLSLTKECKFTIDDLKNIPTT